MYSTISSVFLMDSLQDFKIIHFLINMLIKKIKISLQQLTLDLPAV
jgi:hypothetical protein